MTITRHWIEASVDVDSFWQPTSASPVFVDTLQTPLAWTAVEGSTNVERSYNDARRRFEMRQTFNDGGTPLAGSLTTVAVATVVGKSYRLSAHVYGTSDHVAWVDAAPGVAVADDGRPRLSTSPQEAWTIFTASSTSTTLYLRANSYAGATSTVTWVDVSVVEVASSSRVDLKPGQAEVTLDESWSPYVRASLTCPIPTKDVLAKIDPRKSIRVALTLNQSDNDAFTAGELTAMLAVTGATRTNLVVTPRPRAGGPTWGATASGGALFYESSYLDGPGVIPPSGLPGGMRYIITTGTTVPTATWGPGFADTYGPIAAGEALQGSMFFRSTVPTTAALKLSVSDGATTVASGTGQTRSVPGGVWTRLDFTLTVPVDVLAPVVVIYIAAHAVDLVAGTVVDATQAMVENVAPGTPLGDYFDGDLGRAGNPRGIPVWTGAANASTSIKRFGATTAADFSALFASTSRTNLCINPSFETNTTGWSGTSGTVSRVTSGGFIGAAFARLTVTGAPTTATVVAARVLTTAGASSTVAAWVKGTAGLKATVSGSRFAASTGGSGTGRTSSVVTLTGSWQRVGVTVPAVGGLPWLEVSVRLLPAAYPSAGTIPTGNVLDVDGVLIEETTVLGEYFDGANGPLAWTASWTGTAHASSSTIVLTGVGKAAGYLTDLFGDQYNPTVDTALNVSRTLNLALRERVLDYVAGTMTLELTGDEMALQDFARFDASSTKYTPPVTTSLKALVSWALGLIGASLDPASSDATIDSATVIWNLGETLWSFLDAFIRTNGLRLWCDESTVWRLGPTATGASGAISLNALTAFSDTLSRGDDAYGNAAVVIYEWEDGAGTQQRAYQYASTSKNTTPKTVVQRFNKPNPNTSATPAVALRDRSLTRGRNVVMSAMSDYRATPGQAVAISTPETVVTGAMVSAVTWRFPDDEMDLTTRDAS